MSPECLSKKTYSSLANDIYACAVILFVMVTGTCPSPKSDFFSQLVATQKFDLFWSRVRVPVSADFKDLFERIMTVQSLRPDLEQIKAHPWMQK